MSFLPAADGPPVYSRLCRNCAGREAKHAGGLCRPCYRDPAARAAFPDRRPLIRAAAAARGRVCRHCGRGAACRPRGLCWGCFGDPAVRALYPVTSVFARRGAAEFTGTRPLPAEPTATLPGSPERVAVLAARAAAGEQLFHPLDANDVSGGPPPGAWAFKDVYGKPYDRRVYRAAV